MTDEQKDLGTNPSDPVQNPLQKRTGRRGVTVHGGGPRTGVETIDVREGSSDPVTEPEFGLDQNERDETGRRVFRK